jgi:hypothetical protein
MGAASGPDTKFRIPRRLRRDSRSLAGGAAQPLQLGLERGVRSLGVVFVG